MKEYRKFAADSFFVTIATLFVSLEGIILLPILTKNLTVAQFGIWSQIKVTIALLTPFIYLGLKSSLIRFLTGERNKEIVDKTYSTTVFFSIISAIVMSILVFLFAHPLAQVLTKTDSGIYFQIGAGLLFLRAITSLPTSLFQFKEKYYLHSILKALLSLMNIGIVSYFILSGYSLLGVLLGFIISETLLLIVQLFIIRKYVTFHLPSFSILKKQLAYGFPLTFVPLFHWIFQVGDQYILGIIEGATVVGLYTLAYSLAFILRTIATPIYTILQTRIVKAYNQQNMKLFKTYFEYSYKYLLLILIPGAFGIIFLASPIIEIISTEEFLAAVDVLPILTIGFLLFSLTNFSNNLLKIQKKTKTIRNLFFILAVSNLILNIILIPKFSLYGAAIATFITFVGAFIFSIYIIRKNNLSLQLGFISKALISSGIMSVFVLFIRTMHIPAIAKVIIIPAIAVAVYFILMFFMKSFKKEEIIFFGSLIPVKYAQDLLERLYR